MDEIDDLLVLCADVEAWLQGSTSESADDVLAKLRRVEELIAAERQTDALFVRVQSRLPAGSKLAKRV